MTPLQGISTARSGWHFRTILLEMADVVGQEGRREDEDGKIEGEQDLKIPVPKASCDYVAKKKINHSVSNLPPTSVTQRLSEKKTLEATSLTCELAISLHARVIQIRKIEILSSYCQRYGLHKDKPNVGRPLAKKPGLQAT